MLNTVSIIGLGYIGLPTAALLASRKKRVVGVDVSPQVVETVNRGDIHIVEPELDILVQAAVGAGYLQATTRPTPADAFLIAVPTPLTAERKPDLSHIESAAKSIATVLAKGNLVILESTSPVGTTEQLTGWLSEARPDLSFPQQAGDASDIRIAYCPERVHPGHVVHELVANDRVIGGMTAQCSEAAAALYKLFVRGECVITDVRTAEMCKLAENSFRDVNIAFANELSMICDKQGIDVWELIKLANRHPRVNILQPGCGVGGHCIAVDPWFIVDSAPDDATLIRAARDVNDAKPEWVIRKVDQAIGQLAETGMATEEIRIACLGITFKADIDDVRESPALKIAQALSRRHPGPLAIVEPNLSKDACEMSFPRKSALEILHTHEVATNCGIDDANETSRVSSFATPAIAGVRGDRGRSGHSNQERHAFALSLPSSGLSPVRGERDRREQSNHERHADGSPVQFTQMNLDEAMTWAHILVLLVDHTQFKQLKPALERGQVLIDTRGIWGNTQ